MSTQLSTSHLSTLGRPLVVGTRGSALARWQAEFVIAALKRLAPAVSVELRIIKTAGDRDQTRPLADFGGLGVFTKEIEHALLEREIDVAVHSLKDLPTETAGELILAAVLERQDARDCIVSRHRLGLMQLPPGARVGTASARRAAQVLALRPDLSIAPLRGNADTRLLKAQSDAYDAIVIAAAGLIRLGRADAITEYLPLEQMLPDPGQGALALQIRADDRELAALLASLDHPASRAAVTAERAFLRALGGGCRMPMAAYAELDASDLHLRGLVAAPDGARLVRGELRGPAGHADELGAALAERLLREGAAEILKGFVALPELPLQRKRILITRANTQASELAEKLRAYGAEPVEFPTIAFAPLDDYRALDDALARLREFDWVVFTSANGVRAVADRLRALGLNRSVFESVRVAAIGPGTARALESLGMAVAFVPTRYLGEQIARELPVEAGQRALLLRADIASDTLARSLLARGVSVTDLDAYRTVMPAGGALDLSRIDAVTFTSSSTVKNFMARLDDAARARVQALDIFCIGPVTAETARQLSLPVAAVAAEHTLDGLVRTMVSYYRQAHPADRERS